MDYVEFMYNYMSTPFLAGLGLDVFSTQILAALAGRLTILTSNLLGRQLAGKAGGLGVALVASIRAIDRGSDTDTEHVGIRIFLLRALPSEFT